MKQLGNKGQGHVWNWLTSLIGVVVVITIYIVFNTVLFADDNSLESALIPIGLNVSNSAYQTLRTTWDMWAVAFVFAWVIYLVVTSILKEGNYGLR
jgi:hypothetical protein